MKLDDIKKLHQKKYRSEFGYCLVEGEHLIQELQAVYQQQPSLCSTEIYVTSAYEDWDTPFKKHLITSKQMLAISDTKTPQGILAVVPISGVQPVGSKTDIGIYLHEVQDPGNLGTILRSLAWFGGFRCLLAPGSVDPFNPKVIRSSMGAVFHVPIEQDVSIAELSGRYHRIGCLDLSGKGLDSTEFKQCDCYLFGNEARGIPNELIMDLKTNVFSIPGSGAIDSLNLASAVNICIYERQRRS